MSDVEKSVRDFYDNFGWRDAGDGRGEDRFFRQYSAPYYHYHQGSDARTVGCFAGLTGKLIIAGGGDLPESHIKIAENFDSVLCLDISQHALSISKEKLNDGAELLLGSLLDIKLPDDTFNAAFCAHVLYHVDIDVQEQAVSELIRVTKPGGRIVIVYGNPDSLIRRLIISKARIPLLWKLRRKPEPDVDVPPLYFALQPLSWWQPFEKTCAISFLPWDVMGSSQERELLWNDTVAALVYNACSWFERAVPARAVRWWQYLIVVLDKR